VRFGVLGALAAWTKDGRLAEVRESKVRALLADLLLSPGRPVPAGQLIDDLWGARLPAHPAGALQLKVSRLRQSLEAAEPGSGALVEFRSSGYLLQVDGDALDEYQFAALVERARAAKDPRHRVELLADALGLWRGPPLADFADALFAQPAIARLQEQRLAAIEEQAEARLALGEHSMLAGELSEMVARHPLRERLRGLHMLALYRSGRQAEAVHSYIELRGRLADDLGLDPGPSVAALYQAMLEQAPALDGVQAPPTSAARPRTNIPAMLTDLVGRDAAVADLGALLSERRLVTLTGPGGVGKTRLAISTAAQLAAAYPDGAWLVELAGSAPAAARTPAGEVMAVLGIRDDSSVAQADLLADALRGRRMLLILDNCEHLVDQVAKLAAQLLRSAPELRILVTSREPLMIAGEVVRAVPPLDVPDPAAGLQPAALARVSSVRLFLVRAEASAPGFRLDEDNAQAVAGLCRRLDGIPLALELAATRVRTLGVHELLARLDDRFRLLVTGHRDSPPRQQTLWAVIDWSWQLLTEPEHMVLRRLAVAADGCGLRAAEAICAEDDLDVMTVLSRLVDRSLVAVADRPDGPDPMDGPRYRLLESVAAYSLRRLREAGEYAQARRRHRQFYSGLAERGAARLRGYDQRAWLRCLEAETVNLRTALDSAADEGDAPASFRMVNALAWFWLLSGRLAEAGSAMGEALALPGGSASDRATATAWRSGFTSLAGGRRRLEFPPLNGIDEPGPRAILQWFHAFVASDFGDPSVAENLLGTALAGFRALGDQWGIAAALSTQAKIAMIRGDHTATERLAQQSLEMFRELGDRWGQLQAIEWLGAAVAPADPGRAGRLHRDGLRMAEELGLWPQAADALSWLGRSALRSGDLAQARELLERGMRLAAEQSYRPGQVFAELGLGHTARREGKLDLAEDHLRNVLRTSERIGPGPDVARIVSLSELGFIAEQRGDPVAARSCHLRSLTFATELGDPQAVAQALTGLAGARALGGQPALAARLLGAADTAWRSAGGGLTPSESPDARRITTMTRQALEEGAFEVEFRNGRRLDVRQAATLLRSAGASIARSAAIGRWDDPPQPGHGYHGQRRHDDRADAGHHVHPGGERRPGRRQDCGRGLPVQLPRGDGGIAQRAADIPRGGTGDASRDVARHLVVVDGGADAAQDGNAKGAAELGAGFR
jgi:predicted ATPase/DNA-binding SARP family transcriptional activator